jgi:predicted molibdopterin-dependent oxidoreductase YjgC
VLFRSEAAGGQLDFRVGDPQSRLELRSDKVLLREDRNPNTRGCLDQGLGRDGVDAILQACREGRTQVLVLQGPELLRDSQAKEALSKVPFVAVMATHEEPALDLAHCVLPAALFAEVEGTFTNYARRLQRLRRAVPAQGAAMARLELAAGLLSRLGKPLGATSAREVFALLARETPGYAGLDYRSLEPLGRVVGAETAAAVRT